MDRIELEDLPTLGKLSESAFDWLLEYFPAVEQGSLEGFPKRWKSSILETNFEWVVSEVGSITLRLSTAEGNRRNPAPIFYMSLKKVPNGNFVWADPDGKEMKGFGEWLLEEVQNRVRLYQSSLA